MKYSKIIKAVLRIYVIGNLLFAVLMYFMNTMSYVEECLVRTGISAGMAVFILLTIAAFERLEAKKWEKKSSEIFFGQKDYGLLKCSRGYLQLPIITILMDILVGVMLWQEFGKDFHAYINAVKEEEMLVPLLCLLTFHMVSVLVILYDCRYKVCYTEYGIYMLHFFKEVNIPCGEIRKITYYCPKKRKKEKLIIETEQKKLVLRADVLSDGWNDFLRYINAVSNRRNINFIMKEDL